MSMEGKQVLEDVMSCWIVEISVWGCGKRRVPHLLIPGF